MRKGRGRTPRGFNIIELTIVVAIFAMVAAIAIPGIVGGIQRKGSDGASRRLSDDIRQAQSHALTRGTQSRVVVFDQAGSAPGSGFATDVGKANRYRIEIRLSAAAAWPTLADSPGSNANVLSVWNDLGQFGGVRVTTGNTIAFNSQGFLATSATPLNVTLQGPDGTRTVQTSVIGKATIQ